MNREFRTFWAAAGTVGYVALGGLRSEQGILPWLCLFGLPLLLAEVWRRTLKPRGGSQLLLNQPSRTALRAVAWGGALWLSARAGPVGSPGFDAVANLGTGIALGGCLFTLARVDGTSGILSPPRAARSLDAVIFTALLFGIATSVPATRALLPAEWIRLDPLAIDYVTTAAGIAGLLVLVTATWRLRLLRRLELGVGDRAAGALALALTAFAIAVPAAAFDVAPPDRILPVAVVVAAAMCAWTATTPEPTSVSAALRGILAIILLGVPTLLIAGLLVRAVPDHRGPIVLGACLASIIVGLVARAVARPLGPEQSRWLSAIHAATEDALLPEPDEAIRSALVALTRAAPTPNAKPELWRNDPPEMLSVDVAGYLHVDKIDAPDKLYELAEQEPERTVRAEVLRAVEVRRPDVRSLLSWFDSREAFCATVVADDDGPIGFILLPKGGRRSPMTLEEARAARNLADRLSALLAVSSALARSRQRELAATARADAIDDEKQRLEHIIATAAGKNRMVPNLEAERVRISAHGPAARGTLEKLERIGRLNGPLIIKAELGIDPIGWAAVSHLSSPRRDGPFIVLDGANARNHDVELWRSGDASPLLMADGGTLVVLELLALPLEVQDEICQRLSQRSPGATLSSVLPVSLVAVLSEPTDTLVSQGRLSRSLSRWLGESVVELPPLRERAEDLRSLVLTRLTRVGLRLKGEPMGVEPNALRLLTEHTWPGNEHELDSVLTLTARRASAQVLTARDLSAVGFRPDIPAPPLVTPLPAPSRRRRRRPR